MKLSKYLIISQLSNGNYSVFSTITRSLVMLTTEKYSLASNGDFDKAFSDEEIAFLKDRRFIVEADENELNFLSVSMNKDRLSPKVFSTYIALSTLCNFSCVYCYEKGQVDSFNTMDQETLLKTISWYENTLKSNGYKECKVCLYGGEPLLCEALLKEFVEKLNSVCENKNVKLSYSMITNGYLLKKDICEYLISKGLEEVQITLDGCQEIHDKRRMKKNGEGTFDTIIENIKWIAYNTSLIITIRSSFDSTNSCEIKDLLFYLQSINLHKRIRLYFAPIHQTETQKQTGCSFCSQHIYDDYSEVSDCFVDLYKTSSKLGFETPTCYTNGPCMVLASDSCLIAPNGDLYKCVEMIGKPELCVGNVKEKKYNYRYYDFLRGSIFNECIESGCIYAPLCGGGCTMEALVKNNRLDCKSCHDKIFKSLTGVLNALKCGGELI